MQRMKLLNGLRGCTRFLLSFRSHPLFATREERKKEEMQMHKRIQTF